MSLAMPGHRVTRERLVETGCGYVQSLVGDVREMVLGRTTVQSIRGVDHGCPSHPCAFGASPQRLAVHGALLGTTWVELQTLLGGPVPSSMLCPATPHMSAWPRLVGGSGGLYLEITHLQHNLTQQTLKTASPRSHQDCHSEALRA